MDPQATWNALIEEWTQGNWPVVAELAESLLIWLYKAGFPPDMMPGQSMGTDWNRAGATCLAKFALHRSRLVLNSPNHIPSEIPFTLTCDTCGDEGPVNYGEAVNAGWIGVHYCPKEGLRNFLGRCPDCNDATTERTQSE